MHDVKVGELKFRPNLSVQKNIFFCAGEGVGRVHTELLKMYYGLSTEQCRRLAYETVVVNRIPHPSIWDELKMAGIERFRVLWQGMIH
jgi:hypothetical protein